MSVSTLGYLGSFTAPALIGYLASRSSLPTALLLPAFAVAATAIAAPVSDRPPTNGVPLTSPFSAITVDPNSPDAEVLPDPA